MQNHGCCDLLTKTIFEILETLKIAETEQQLSCDLLTKTIFEILETLKNVTV